MVTDFQKTVFSLCKKVPKGKVTTYKELGRKLGKRGQIYRAVGRALNENKSKSVPCHRVVCSNGYVGGFARGKKEKIRLLKKEGIKITNKKINLNKYLYRLK